MIDPGLWRICRWHDLEDTRYTWQRPLSYSRNAWQLCERRCYFSRGGTLSRGQVIERKHDAYVNTVGWANDNPNLDSRHFLVEFEDGEVTELTANIISGSIYATCDPEWEWVILFVCIVDFKSDKNSMTLTDHNFVESRGKAHNYSQTRDGNSDASVNTGQPHGKRFMISRIVILCRLPSMLLHKALTVNHH